MAEKKTYEFWFNVTESWKASFVAESDEEAKKILEQIADDEIETSEVPGYFEKNKGLETEYDMYSLEDETGRSVR